MVEPIEKKFERLKNICTTLEQDNKVWLWGTQKYRKENDPVITSFLGSFRVRSPRRMGTSYLAYHLARVSSRDYATCLIYPDFEQLRFFRWSFEGDDVLYFPNNIDWMTLSNFEKNKTDYQVCIYDLGNNSTNIREFVKYKDLTYPNSIFLIFSSDL